MSKLELFKPFMELNNKSNPIIFNELGFDLEFKGKTKGIRPIIIFYDKKNDNYWYIKSRDALNKKNTNKKKFKGEILIEKSNIGLFKKDSYIDCSQIFKIDAYLLESLVNKNHKMHNQTSVLEKNQQELILNKINNYLNQEPPYLSIVEVYKEKDKIKGSSLYLCPEKYNFLEESQKESIEYKNRLYEAKSNKDSDKYLEAIEFKENFQEEYFPSQFSKMKM